MKAIILEDLSQGLKYSEDYPFNAQAENVVVDLKYGALNHRDIWITKSLYPGISLPIILGSDGAGIYQNKEVVICPGLYWGNNERVQSDDFQVLGMPTNGTFAEKIEIPEEYIYAKPKHLSLKQAGALPLAGLTAYRALITKCKPQGGEKVLISGIGGGVALFAFQFALALGCEVFVTSGKQDKIDKAIALGAKGGANYKEENWTKELKKMSSGGFDIIIDSAGGDGFASLAMLTNPGARMAFYGGTVGNINNLNPRVLFWRQVNIMGSTMGSPKDFSNMLTFVEEHKITPIIDQVFDLKDAKDAFEKMDKGLQFGKLVLEI